MLEWVWRERYIIIRNICISEKWVFKNNSISPRKLCTNANEKRAGYKPLYVKLKMKEALVNASQKIDTVSSSLRECLYYR